MRAGMVSTIRINPRDCQSVLDIMEMVGYKTEGQSFPHLVSLTLSSLLQTQRDAGNIPEPDEFDYLNRMGYFIGQQRSSKKMHVAKVIHNAGGKARMPGLPQQPVDSDEDRPFPTQARHTPSTIEVLTTEVTAEQREAGQRLQDLMTKKEIAEDNPNVIWSAHDQREYDILYAVIYPFG